MWEMKRLPTILAAAVMLVLAVGCSNNNAEVEQLHKELDEIKAATPTPTPVSRIAFHSDRYGDAEIFIFVMDADGTNVVITN
jgi:hypothetical protein